MKALVGDFNQEKALVGAFSVIVKTDCGTDGALHSTTLILHGESLGAGSYKYFIYFMDDSYNIHNEMLIGLCSIFHSCQEFFMYYLCLFLWVMKCENFVF